MSGLVAASFGVVALLGMPIAFALGAAAILGLWYAQLPFTMLAEKMLFSVDSFPLIAIPLFMIAGELMVAGGVMARLIAFANALVGGMRGGLAQVAVASGTGMACISGTAVADATAPGSLLIKPMSRHYGVPLSPRSSPRLRTSARCCRRAPQ